MDTTLSSLIAARLDTDRASQLQSVMDMEAVRAYLKSKKGVIQSEPFNISRTTFWIANPQREDERLEVDHLTFATLNYRTQPMSLSLAGDPDVMASFSAEYPQTQRNTRWSGGIPLDGSIPPEKIVSMIDQTYEYLVQRLPPLERSFIELMDGMPLNEAKLRQLLTLCDLDEFTDKLDVLFRDAIWIRAHPFLDPSLKQGQSFFGGIADFPDDIPYPTCDGWRMHLIAHIMIDDLPDCPVKRQLPKTGRLYFFWIKPYTVPNVTAYDDWSNPKFARVIHEPRERFVKQDDIYKIPLPSPETLFKQTYLEFFPGYVSVDTPAYYEQNNSHDTAFYQKLSDLAVRLNLLRMNILGETPQHWLFGHEESIQYNSIVTDLDDRLLLQIDSDDAADLMWGDSGRLFFFASQTDIEAHQYQNAYAVEESL